MTEHRRRFYHGSDPGRARARTRDLPQKIALKGRRKSPCNEAVGPLKIGADWNGSCARWAVTGCKHPVPVFSHERSERAVARGGFAARQRLALARACTARRRGLRLTRCEQRVPGFGAEAPLHFVAQNLFCVTKCVSCYLSCHVESRIMMRSGWVKDRGDDGLPEAVREAHRRS